MRNQAVHFMTHFFNTVMHSLWTACEQGKPGIASAKIGTIKERSRGVLVTPARLLTASFHAYGRRG